MGLRVIVSLSIYWTPWIFFFVNFHLINPDTLSYTYMEFFILNFFRLTHICRNTVNVFQTFVCFVIKHSNFLYTTYHIVWPKGFFIQDSISNSSFSKKSLTKTLVVEHLSSTSSWRVFPRTRHYVWIVSGVSWGDARRLWP